MLRRLFRPYLIATIAAPVAGRLMVKRAETMRARDGHSPAADRWEQVGSLLQRGRRRRRWS